MWQPIVESSLAAGEEKCGHSLPPQGTPFSSQSYIQGNVGHPPMEEVMVTVGAACLSMSWARGCSFPGEKVNLGVDFFFCASHMHFSEPDGGKEKRRT